MSTYEKGALWKSTTAVRQILVQIK